MAQYKNEKNVGLSVAVWLAMDSYDHNFDPMSISVTSVIKPIKQIILGTRAASSTVPGMVEPEELSNLVASRMGTAFHDSIENAWVGNYKQSLEALGYPKRVIDMVKVNPEKDELDEDTIPIYLERRSSKTVGPYTISGKFDFVGDGRVEDFKSTGTYTYQKGTNDHKYILQGSIYRWLNQDIITQDIMAIQFIFTDWKAQQAMSDKSYPQNRVLEHKLNLMSIPATQTYLDNKVNQIIRLIDAEEVDIPDCTPEDLWQSKSVWKYYKNPAKRARSTKNFDDPLAAQQKAIADGNVGVVVEVKGQVRACMYCNARNLCKQKDTYIAAGTLKL